MDADRALLRRPPADLGAEVVSGKLAARELVGAALAAIEADDPALQCFIAVDGDRAMADAAAIDERVAAGEQLGSLAGVPLAVKDNEDAAGYVTTFGSSAHRSDPPATSDSVLVQRLKAAGCVVVGKTNLPELAWKGDSVNAWGQATQNPWQPGRSAGGSSGGSAAAVAAGVVPLATASDGGGSIRIPAALCGLTGLKTSVGRVPAGGHRPVSWPDLSVKGLQTARIADVVPALDAVLGPEQSDLRSLPMSDAPWSRGLGDLGVPLRVAWSPNLGFGTVDREIAEACGKAVDVLAGLGSEVVEVPTVWDTDPLWDWLAIVAAANARTLAPLRGTDGWDEVDPGLAQLADYGASLTGIQVLQAMDAAHRRNLALVEVFHKASVLLCPTVAGQTPKVGGQGSIDGIETESWVQYTYGFNLTRSPCGTVNCGFTSDGMPIGLQVVGPQHADVAVLRCLLVLEDALGAVTPPNTM
jgi:aspartyl-tRNA(Asn)/glutamyl-tRNA(Gln) amidotransferase subunit A